MRRDRGWDDSFIVINVCRFHAAERNYKGVYEYVNLYNTFKKLGSENSTKCRFVLCGKGNASDVRIMESLGLTVCANVSDNELIDLYCAADAYINFSKWGVLI